MLTSKPMAPTDTRIAIKIEMELMRNLRGEQGEEIASNRRGRLSIGPPLKAVWTLPFSPLKHVFFEGKLSNLPVNPVNLKNSLSPNIPCASLGYLVTD